MEKYSLSKAELTAGGLYYSNEGLHRRSDGTIPSRHTTGQGIHRTSVRFTQPARPSHVAFFPTDSAAGTGHDHHGLRGAWSNRESRCLIDHEGPCTVGNLSLSIPSR